VARIRLKVKRKRRYIASETGSRNKNAPNLTLAMSITTKKTAKPIRRFIKPTRTIYATSMTGGKATFLISDAFSMKIPQERMKVSCIVIHGKMPAQR
jgi:hypothetical protein